MNKIRDKASSIQQISIEKKKLFMQSHFVQKKQGFTLIEVLVAMVIMAVGLLGLASLQALALKDNQDAYYRSQANFLLYEMGERIRANADYWKRPDTDPQAVIADAKSYNPGTQPYCNIMDPGSGSLGCTQDSQARYDVYRWWQDIRAMLPLTLHPTIDIAWEGDAATMMIGGNEEIELTLTWDRSNQARYDGSTSLLTTTLKLDVRL